MKHFALALAVLLASSSFAAAAVKKHCPTGEKNPISRNGYGEATSGHGGFN